MDSSSTASSPSPGPALLRELRRADREPLAALLRATGAFADHEIDVALELIDEALAAKAPQPDDYRFFVAEAAGTAARIAGYVCFGRSPMATGIWDVYWIAVDPRLHGRGIGAALLRAAEAQARAGGGRMVLIETGGKESYSATRRFYERSGYHEVARIPDFFAPGDDKVIYARRLDGQPLPVRPRAA